MFDAYPISQEREWDGLPITEPGLYRNVPIERYHSDPGLFNGEFSISSTGLKAIARRPLEYWRTSHYNPFRKEPKSTDAFEFGKAAHMLILGEDGFSERYALQPDTYINSKGVESAWNYNSNVCRSWRDEMRMSGRSIITNSEIEAIREIANSLRQKTLVQEGILNGLIERSVFHKIGSIWVRVRPDVWPRYGGDFVDFKTAASVDDESLSKALYETGNYIQAGLTRWVVRELFGDDAFSSFTFAYAEKSEPFDVRFKQLDQEDLDLGELQARRAFDILEHCIQSGEWPGYDGHEDDVTWTRMSDFNRKRVRKQLGLPENG